MQIGSQQKRQYKQNGFILLLMIVVLAIIVTLWIAGKHKSLVSIFKTNDINADFNDLELVKGRLLAYATLHPEVYSMDSGSYHSSSQIPAPGFFPCPDLNADGEAETICSNSFMPGQATLPYEVHTGFVPANGNVGYVPEAITSKHVYFSEKERYFYFLDERFSFNNGAYSVSNNRFTPMNLDQFEGEVHSGLADSTEPFEPVLTLNGKTGYIALIIDPGEDGLDAINNVDADGYITRHFTSNASDLSDDINADKIVGITFADWSNAINRRLCVERFRYEGLEFADQDGDGNPDEINPFTAISSTLKHWYNSYDETDNPGGSSWRDTEWKCKYDY